MLLGGGARGAPGPFAREPRGLGAEWAPRGSSASRPVRPSQSPAPRLGLGTGSSRWRSTRTRSFRSTERCGPDSVPAEPRRQGSGWLAGSGEAAGPGAGPGEAPREALPRHPRTLDPSGLRREGGAARLGERAAFAEPCECRGGTGARAGGRGRWRGRRRPRSGRRGTSAKFWGLDLRKNGKP